MIRRKKKCGEDHKNPFSCFLGLLPIVENRLHCVGKLLDQISHLLRLSRFFVNIYYGVWNFWSIRSFRLNIFYILLESCWIKSHISFALHINHCQHSQRRQPISKFDRNTHLKKKHISTVTSVFLSWTICLRKRGRIASRTVNISFARVVPES